MDELSYEEQIKKSFEELVDKAKKRVVKEYEGNEETNREWVEAVPRDSYENPDYRVKILVLEGSPVKGYVVVNYGTKTVTAFSAHDRKIMTYRWASLKL